MDSIKQISIEQESDKMDSIKQISIKQFKELLSSPRKGAIKQEVEMHVRNMFTGMLPGAIKKFEELLADATALSPVVEKGYDYAAGQDSFYAWGVACRITCSDMAVLKNLAEGLGITCLSVEGDMAYTGGLTIDNFKSRRVNGELKLMPEEKE